MPLQIKKSSKLFFECYSVILCILLASPLIAAAVFTRTRSSLLFHSLLFLAGWLIWTWIEYHVHRFLMHPKEHAYVSGASKSHQHHHKHPSQLDVTLSHRILLFVFSNLFFYLAYRWNNYFTLFAGLFWGSAAFCYIHYLLHHRWTRIFLPNHHLFHIYHHCKYTDKCYGVSVTWWDYLFFTAPPKNAQISPRIVEFYYNHNHKKQNH